MTMFKKKYLKEYTKDDVVVVCDDMIKARAFLEAALEANKMRGFVLNSIDAIGEGSPEKEFNQYSKIGYSLSKGSYCSVKYWSEAGNKLVQFDWDSIMTPETHPEMFL